MNTLSFFEKNTDAIATNRGFYFQYLNTLKSWIDIYVSNSSDKIYCEVEDDYKKINSATNSIEFTQFKCYSTSFSFSSKEIQKSFYNFYCLYYKYFSSNPKFHFVTNSTISPSETLLVEWDRFQISLRPNHLVELESKISPILEKQFNEFSETQIKNIEKQKLNISKRSPKTEKKQKENTAAIIALEDEIIQINKELNEILNHLKSNLKSFIKNIKLDFQNKTPEESILDLQQDCLLNIKEIKGLIHTEELFLGRLLTEIYRKSSTIELVKRNLDKDLLVQISLESKDQLESNCESMLVSHINKGLSNIKESIDSLNDNVQALREQFVDYEKQTPSESLLFKHYEEEEISSHLEKEKTDLKKNPHQSNLENKINDIDWKDLEQKEYMLQNATELRCRYAIYMEELKLSGQREYNILRSLEKEIKTICIQAVDKYSLEVNFDSTAYWLDFENQLKDKIKEYSSLCQINLQESFVYAQMFQIAAECQLKWANKIVTK